MSKLPRLLQMKALVRQPRRRLPVEASFLLRSGSARGTGRADGISSSMAGSVELYISKLKNIVSEDQLEPTVQAIRRQLATTIGPTPQDQLEGLIYLAAWLNVQLIHERNSSMIFGSQIRLLAQMNSQREVTPAEAMQVYNEAKAAYPDFYRSFTFEEWMGFLTTAGLCAMGPINAAAACIRWRS